LNVLTYELKNIFLKIEVKRKNAGLLRYLTRGYYFTSPPQAFICPNDAAPTLHWMAWRMEPSNHAVMQSFIPTFPL
jgi:hypothetical protein